MKVSFFKNGTSVIGIDCSYTPAVLDEETGEIVTPIIPGSPEKGHPDCLKVFDVDFDPATQIATLMDGEIIITDRPTPPETPEEKHDRIYQSIISSESLDGFDLEGQEFTDIEKGDLITARCFGGNPHAEKALTNKVLAVAIGLLQGEPMTPAMGEKIAQAQAKKAEVDAVRNLFNLGKL